MKNYPRILITTSLNSRGTEFSDLSHDLSDRYVAAVTAAGGLPLLLPVFENPGDERILADAVANADGIVLSGGCDVAAELYTRELPPEVRKTISAPSPRRDWTESVVINQAFQQRKPLLAICRGLQILNVALGGTLIADIPLQVGGQVPHNRQDKKDGIVHQVTVADGSLLSRIVKKSELWVNSTHHQAAGRVGRGLCVTAQAPDGVIEALEPMPGSWPAFLLAVQFHPERLLEKQAEHFAIFKYFIASCKPS